MGCVSSKETQAHSHNLPVSNSAHGAKQAVAPSNGNHKANRNTETIAADGGTNAQAKLPLPQNSTSPAMNDEDEQDSDFETDHDSDSDWDDYLVQQTQSLLQQSPQAPNTPMRPDGGYEIGTNTLRNGKKQESPLKETASLRLSKLRGCTFVNQYVVIKYLGRGASGRVFLCMDINSNKLFAVKIVRKGILEAQLAARPDAPDSKTKQRRKTILEDLLAEISVMRTLKHRNIVTLREVVDDPESNKLLLVMDYMEGGPVMTREALDKGHRIPEAVARHYFRDMLKALDYLHMNKIVHGDLKPENVLMSSKGNVALSDFGCSKLISGGDDTLDRCNGTPAFLAPEMMRPKSKYRGRPADIYALGACLYTFIFGRIPFNAPSVVKLFQVVQTQPLTFPENMPVSEHLYDLLSSMLEKNPDKRINLRSVMAHPWVTMDGAWPCRTIRQMRNKADGMVGDEDMLDFLPTVDMGPRHSLDLTNMGGGHERLLSLDFMATANVVDMPEEDYLTPVAASVEEKVLSAGQVLIKQGDVGTSMYYIVEGQVDVIIKLRNLGGSSGKDDKDETPVAELPSTIVEAALKAQDFISKRKVGKREFVVSTRGPGEFVGIMSLFSAPPVRSATVRAKSVVRVRIIPLQHLLGYLSARPEAKNQLQQMLWSRQSDNLVLEALAHLSMITDVLENLLTTHRDMEGMMGDA